MARLRHSLVLLWLVLSCSVASGEQPEGIEIRAIEEQPRALHLISWRAPPAPAGHAPQVDADRMARLWEPLNDQQFLTHLGFRQTLRLRLNDNKD